MPKPSWPIVAVIPLPMRSWPVLRRWFWQQHEVDDLMERARLRAAALQQLIEPAPPVGATETGRPVRLLGAATMSDTRQP